MRNDIPQLFLYSVVVITMLVIIRLFLEGQEMSKQEKLYKEATGFHKTVQLIASKFTGYKACHPDEHAPFIILFRSKDGVLVRAKIVMPGADSEWIKDQDDYFTSLIVNAAFSLELHLKYLILVNENKDARGHKLLKLYEQLSPRTQANLQSVFSAISDRQPLIKQSLKAMKESDGIDIPWRIKDLLRESGKAFTKWRYLYEDPTKSTSFAGYGELVYAIRVVSGKSKGFGERPFQAKKY